MLQSVFYLTDKYRVKLTPLLLMLEFQIPTSHRDRSQQTSSKVLIQGRHRLMTPRGSALPHSRLLASKMAEMSQALSILHLHSSLMTLIIIGWILMSPISAPFRLQEGGQSSRPDNWAATSWLRKARGLKVL